MTLSFQQGLMNNEKSKFSKCQIPSTAFFIYEIAFFTTKVGSLVEMVNDDLVIWPASDYRHKQSTMH